MLVFKQVNFVFPKYYSMNDNMGRLSEFFKEIHQLMSNDGTLEEVQLRISEANAMLNRLKPDLEQDVIQNLDNIIQAMKDDLKNLKTTVHKGFAAERSKTGK